MANTFSNIIPTLMAKALPVLRESCIMPRLVNTDFSNVPAGQGDTVNVIVASAASVSDVSASETPVTPPNYTPTKATVTLNKWRKGGVHITDKDRGSIGTDWMTAQIAEVIRALANDVNSYIFGLYKGIYGYAGAAGTTPFGTDLSEATAARKVLNTQLAPLTDRRIVLDPSAEANAILRLANYNLRGKDSTLTSGQIGTILGSDWYMDQAVPTHTANADGAGASTVNGVNAAGASTLSIAKAAGASKNAVAGDVLEIASGPAKGTYVITADVTIVHTANTSVAISPPLRGATAGGETITYKATHVVNLNFHRDAFAFASRPLQSDAANSDNIMSVADPVSQVVLRVEKMRQNKQDYYEFDILFGATLVRPELAARIAG